MTWNCKFSDPAGGIEDGNASFFLAANARAKNQASTRVGCPSWWELRSSAAAESDVLAIAFADLAASGWREFHAIGPQNVRGFRIGECKGCASTLSDAHQLAGEGLVRSRRTSRGQARRPVRC